MTIITNHQWRPFVYRTEVPAKILKEDFDWTNEDDIDGFFQYRGHWYHMSEFMVFSGLNHPLKGWDGYRGDSFFSGEVIKISSDGEQYQVGRYFL